MRFVILVAVVLAIAYLVGSRRSRRAAPVAASAVFRVADAPRVLARLEATGGDGSFAAFMFGAAGGNGPDDPVDLQYSIEGGRPGLDWILLAPRNVRDQERFARLARDLGHRVERRESNDVPYLRVEGGDLARLGTRVMQDLYRLAPDDEVEVLVEGFHLRTVRP